MAYSSDPGQFPMFERAGHESSVLVIVREPIKPSALRLRRNFYFYKIKIFTDPITESFIAVEAFKRLIASPIGDIRISNSDEPFWVSSERLETCLIGTEDLISLS